MERGEFVEVEKNVCLHIRDWGHGKPIVFIPGWPLGHEMYEYQFVFLPQHGYRCVGISLRGFGSSSKPWGPYSYDVFTDDIQVVLEKLDLREVTLVGFSMGGAVAVRYLTRHGRDRVAKLVLCGAAVPSFTVRPGFPFGVEPGAVDGLIEMCHADRARMSARFVDQYFRGEESASREFKRWLQAMAMQASPHAVTACLIALRDVDLHDDMAKIEVETIVFHGVHDRICPFQLAVAMTAGPGIAVSGSEMIGGGVETLAARASKVTSGIDGARLVRFENSGHGLFFEEKDKFNQELMHFVEGKANAPPQFFP